MSKIINKLDNKIIKRIEKIILSLSKERKELYNQLNNRLLHYSESKLLELLKYDQIQIDQTTREMIYDRFNYLKYKYEKIIPNLNIHLDTQNMYLYSYTIIEEAIIVLNEKQIYHLANQFKLPIEETLETIIVYSIGNILNRDIDLDIINESKKIFIKNANQTILYRLGTEDSAWSTGIEFLNDLNIKYRDNIYDLFKYYSLGCYTMHYRNLVWCCISV